MTKRTLRLTRERLAVLGSAELGRVAGGTLETCVVRTVEEPCFEVVSVGRCTVLGDCLERLSERICPTGPIPPGPA